MVRSDEWLAGILEGEGSFAVCASPSRGARRHRLQVAIEMTDLDVLESVAVLCNSKVNGPYVNTHGVKRTYRINLYGATAEDCMRRVLPYMHVRRAAKIEECLATPNLSHYPKEGI